ncbi:S53 family peptidase [Amycolatopsis pigmentata]|uniref:Protease pro-enzyme activation domain-containing protein n=1 Tax=Amycolatopsis pigmentata TaxID=450801 RepID=A0ABW5FMC3_9PSEU
MRQARYRLALATACAATLTMTGVGTALAGQSRVPLTGTGYQTDYGLIDNGPSDTGIVVSDNIHLGVRDPAALAAHARSESTPGSPDYGKQSTPQQNQAENELTPAQLGRIRDWLTSAGLTVTQPNWRTLKVTGTLGQMASAFDVTFDDYTDPDTRDPYHWQIPKSELSVPADLGPLVLALGTDSFPVPISGRANAKDSVGTVGTGINRPAKLGGVSYPRTSALPADSSSKCSKYWGEQQATSVPLVNGQTPTLAPCGYTPKQLKHAYGLDEATETGRGETVAVVMPAMDTLEHDVNTWSAHTGTQQLRTGQLTVVPTPDGSAPPLPQEDGGGMIENTMDVEAVHGMAPDANIVSIGMSTENYGTVLDSLIYALDHTRASVVSLSLAFAAPPGLGKAYDQLYQEGALQGVGFYYSSGDGGHDPAGNFFNPAAASDWTTAVGGTSLAIGPDGSRMWETGWGDGTSRLSSDGQSWQQPESAGGAGGGWMVGLPRPWYQRGVVSDQEATGPDGMVDRTGPDVAMDADGTTGMLVGGTPLGGSPTSDPSTWQYTEARIGGTSLSAPLFAGVQALAQQARGGKPLGFANPVLYRLAYTGAFRDIDKLPGAVPAAVTYRQVAADGTRAPVLFQLFGQMPVTPPLPTTPQVGRGFDTETGIGAPTVRYLSLVHGD